MSKSYRECLLKSFFLYPQKKEENLTRVIVLLLWRLVFGLHLLRNKKRDCHSRPLASLAIAPGDRTQWFLWVSFYPSVEGAVFPQYSATNAAIIPTNIPRTPAIATLSILRGEIGSFGGRAEETILTPALTSSLIE